jgi:hypothetical protein
MRALCLLAGALAVVPTTGVFARAGTSFLDSTRDFGINQAHFLTQLLGRQA